MAKFYDYAYHEDEFPEKKKLTNEDIDFLVNLQKEMNTQGHIAQADPRFWVISDKERINYVSEDEDGIEIYDSDNTNSLSLKEFATKLEEEILPEMYPDGYRFETILHSDFNMVLSIYRIAPLEEIEENFPYIEDIIDFLNNRGYSFRINRYRERSVELAGNFFLTHKDAKEYLKRCSHHYSENAHTFAMTCESPEVQRLYNILHKTDFTALKALEQQPSDCISREAVIDHINLYPKIIGDRSALVLEIKKLSPVTPQRPKGKWIDVNDNDSHGWGAHKCHVCSECKDYYTTSAYEMKYCPNCGAKMDGDTKSEDNRNEIGIKSEWIPVSECGYPKIEDEYKYFLVTDDKGKVSVQEFLISLDDEPQPYFSGMMNVIAWMPLPQPYKEVQNDED